MTEDLEGGAHRPPGHFDGVATVVSKLFLQSRADLAFFGEKDYQQLQVVTRLSEDLDIETEVIGCPPTVREEDGLAMSSRNVLLSPSARAIAPAMYRAMLAAAAGIQGGTPVDMALEEARAAILAAGYTDVEYIELRTSKGLKPATDLSEPTRLLSAAMLDGVRLIDNIAV